MTEPVKRRVFTMRKPPFVSEIIANGVYGHIGLLADDPSKVFKFCAPDYDEAVESIEQEKEILKILGSHPFIIDLHWVSDRGLCFEYYPLGSLRSHYETVQPDLPELHHRIKWCQQATDGIVYIHSKGIVHNDISARNILLSSCLDVKICDFGFSTTVGSPLTGGPKPRYSRTRQDVELYSCFLDDLFSLGSLFYEILTGDRPYKDISTSEIFKRFANHTFPSLESVRPERFAEAINRCWNEKYQSVVDLQIEIGQEGHSADAVVRRALRE